MYFPYLRGRQFELIALRELLEGKRISEKVIPIIEPVKPSSTLLKTLETFVKNGLQLTLKSFEKLEMRLQNRCDDLTVHWIMCQRSIFVIISST